MWRRERQPVARFAAAATLITSLSVTVPFAASPGHAADQPTDRTARMLVQTTGADAWHTTAAGEGLVLGDMFAGADGSVAFDTRQTGSSARATVELRRPSTGWSPGDYEVQTPHDLIIGCSATTELEIVAATEADGVPTTLVGSFRQQCANSTTATWGHIVFPATHQVAVLDVPRTPIPLETDGVAPVTVTVTAHNIGELPLTVGPVQWTAPGVTPAGVSITKDTCSGATIVGHTTCTLDVTYDPTTGGTAPFRLAFPNDGLQTPGAVPTVTLTPARLPDHSGELHPLTPAAIFSGAVVPGTPAMIETAGTGGVPPSGVQGVMLNVTVRGQKASGSVAVVAGDAGAVSTVSVAFGPKKPTNNLVLAKLSPGGTLRVDVTTAAVVTVHVLAWISDGTVRDEGLRMNLSLLGRTDRYLTSTMRLTTSTALFDPLSGMSGSVLTAVEITSPSADAELRVWQPRGSESDGVTIQVEGGQKRMVMMLLTLDRYGDAFMRLTKGSATVRLRPLVTLAERTPSASSIRLLDTPTPMFDTSLTTPLAAKSVRQVSASQRYVAVLGNLRTWSSGTGGAVSMISPGLGHAARPSLAHVYARRGATVANLGFAFVGFDTASVANDTSRSTHARYDVVAELVDGTGFANGTATSDAAQHDLAEPPAPAVTIASSAPVLASDSLVTVSRPVASFGPSAGATNGPLTEVRPATFSNSGGQISFVDGPTPLISFWTGSPRLEVGHYLANFDDVGVVACGLGGRRGRLDLDHVEYDGDTLTRITGRATIACSAGGNGEQTIQFAYPADAPAPRLQLDDRIMDLPDASFLSGTTKPLTVRNIGNAPLEVGTIGVRAGGSRAPFVTLVDDHCSGTAVAAGDSCTVGVHFQPDNLYDRPHGDYYERDWLTIPTNSTADGRVTLLAVHATSTLGDSGLAHFVSADVLDSETGQGLAASEPIAPGAPPVMDLAAAAGVDPADMTGAIVELSVWGSTAAGTLTLTADGVAPGQGISLAFARGEQLTHDALVAVSPDGLSRLHASTAVNVKVRLVAYLGSANAPETGDGYVPDEAANGPVRVVDTRRGRYEPRGALSAGVEVASTNQVPRHAPIVVTVAAPKTSLTVKVWRWGEPESSATTLLFTKGIARSSTVFLPGPDSLIKIKASASVHVAVDVLGKFEAEHPRQWRGRIFVFARPVRDIDSRTFGKGGTLSPRRYHGWSYEEYEDNGVGLEGLLGTVTTVNTTVAGTLQFFDPSTYYVPSGVSTTTRRRVEVSNFVSVSAGARATIIVYSPKGTTQYVWDVSGYVSGVTRGWYQWGEGQPDRGYQPTATNSLARSAHAPAVSTRVPTTRVCSGDVVHGEIPRVSC